MKTARIDAIARLKAQKEIIPYIKEELQKVASPNISDIVTVMMNELNILARRADQIVKGLMEMLVKEAHEKGITLKAVAHCCHRDDCFTCLGKFHAHFPYVYIWDEEKKAWSIIRTRNLRTWAKKNLDLGDGFALLLDQAMDVRVALIKLHNYLGTLLNHLGIVHVIYE